MCLRKRVLTDWQQNDPISFWHIFIATKTLIFDAEIHLLICYSINIALFLGKEEIALVIDTAAGSDPPFNKGNFKIINMISCIHNCITLYFVDPAIYKWLHKFFYFYGSTHSWHDSHLIKPGCFRTSRPHKSIIIQFLIFFKALFKNCWLSIHTHITSSSS